MKTCLLLVGTALIHKTDPAHLPELPCDAYQKALFQLHFEQQEYKKALQHGKAIQLAIPIEHCQHRRLLVDAFIAQEDIALGCAKYFLRNDFQHTWRKQGFSLLALYRPNEKGSGNEMVVSVDPSSGIYLRDLWQALENAENIAWQQQRPTDNPRRIQSYSEDNGELVANAPNQPWWDDYGRYTLIAAPKNNQSKLSWHQLLAEIWRLYQPTTDLKVRDYVYENQKLSLTDSICDIYQCQSLTQQGKRLLAMQWDNESTPCQSMLIPPTFTAILAALTQQDYAQGVMLEDLPDVKQYQVMELTGGLAILSADGVVLFNNWELVSLDLEALTLEFFKLNHLVERLVQFEQKYGKNKLVNDYKNQLLHSENLNIELEQLILAKLELTQVAANSLAAVGHAQILRFRQQLELQWGLQHHLDSLYQTIAQREATLKDLISLRHDRYERLQHKKEVRFRALVAFCGAFLTAALLLKEIVFVFFPELKVIPVELAKDVHHNHIYLAEGGIIITALIVAAIAFWHEKKSLLNRSTEVLEDNEEVIIHHALVNKRQGRH